MRQQPAEIDFAVGTVRRVVEMWVRIGY